ncbi:hypothetical protein AAFN85_09015 [Mucilaginibacter sp. CAU 1740]|uniref:hypothetical protein n=1 Tax=Mucilaginibacter sp. CAU 1740 TaxID=3140365 RepID=UPI00325AD626
MFNWFKRKRYIHQDWDFGDISDWDVVQNPDSLQYVNKDGTRVIYFSLLKVSGDGVLSTDSIGAKPTILKTDDGWQLKGVKKLKNQILVCVISVGKQDDDIEWAKTFFDSIKPR